MLLHKNTLHRRFYTQALLYTLEPHFVRKSCTGYLVEIAILLQFLTIESDYVRKGCAGQAEIAIAPQFLTIEPHFMRKVGGTPRIALLPHFLTIEPRFVRKGFTSNFGNRTSFHAKGLRGTPSNRQIASIFGDRSSFRAKGLCFVPSRWHCLCPRLQKRNRKEGEGKRARGEDVKIKG